MRVITGTYVGTGFNQERLYNEKALFEAERRGELYSLKMLKHWAELHNLQITTEDIDHHIASLEQSPEQPLARITYGLVHTETTTVENEDEN